MGGGGRSAGRQTPFGSQDKEAPANAKRKAFIEKYPLALFKTAGPHPTRALGLRPDGAGQARWPRQPRAPEEQGFTVRAGWSPSRAPWSRSPTLGPGVGGGSGERRVAGEGAAGSGVPRSPVGELPARGVGWSPTGSCSPGWWALPLGGWGCWGLPAAAPQT